MSEGRAAAFAATAHMVQRRKYTGEPYIVHPCAVARLVRGVVSEDGLMAAWLHDTVEDCGVSLDVIANRFGSRVRAIVSGLTSWTKHPDAPASERDGPRAMRKARDLDWLAEQDCETQTIKVADLIDNTESIVANDPKFARIYLPEKAALLRALRLADPVLSDRGWSVLKAGLASIGLDDNAGGGK